MFNWNAVDKTPAKFCPVATKESGFMVYRKTSPKSGSVACFEHVSDRFFEKYVYVKYLDRENSFTNLIRNGNTGTIVSVFKGWCIIVYVIYL